MRIYGKIIENAQSTELLIMSANEGELTAAVVLWKGREEGGGGKLRHPFMKRMPPKTRSGAITKNLSVRCKLLDQACLIMILVFPF